MKKSIEAATKTRRVTQWRAGQTNVADDVLIVEEPLEIRLDGRRFTATMRTPGHDVELARGLLFTEGVVQSNDDIESIIYSTRCRDINGAHNDDLINVVNVVLHDSDEVPAHLWERTLISNSSCGLCGKGSIEALKTKVSSLPDCDAVSPKTLLALPHLMRQRQTLFQQTGGLHAAGIFDGSGQCLALFEDIGRHNATDKAIGFGLEQGWLPYHNDKHKEQAPLVLLVSGRGSFEITQKALMARIPIVCSVSAASTLAVELAEANNQTTIGFLRDAAFTIYCGAQRINCD